ncbi:hypothetical protein, partial [Streptococcus suis]|uniref:hypothetical protein n=1 Tax=Streptococcus suis TaxID=1307 RepID=UPI002FC6C7DE
TSLLRVRVNISAQWLIGRFVRVLHSKSDLINCAGAGRQTLFLPFVKSIKALSKKIKHNSSYFEAATLFLSLI